MSKSVTTYCLIPGLGEIRGSMCLSQAMNKRKGKYEILILVVNGVFKQTKVCEV